MSKEAFTLPAHGWAPRRDQLPVWRQLIDPKLRKAVVVAHRRYGKDSILLNALAIHAIQKPASYAYFLPEYSQIRRALWGAVDAHTGMNRVVQAFPDQIVAKRENDIMELTLINGSTISFMGSDRGDSLVGAGYAGVVMSEAALSDPISKALLTPMIEQSGGFMVELSTPRGHNGFHRSYVSATEDMQAGVPGVYSSFIDAEHSSVFPPEQLLRIRMDLHRDHGHAAGEAMYLREYLCDFSAQLANAVWGKELAELQDGLRIGDFPHIRGNPTHTAWDIGVADQTVILFLQNNGGGMWTLIDGYEANNIGLDAYAEVLRDKYNAMGYRYGNHWAGHDVANREWVRGVSRLEEAKRYGINFTRTPNTRIKTQLAVAARFIRMLRVNKNSPGAMAAYERFKAYSYPKLNQNGVQSEIPIHDAASHASSALCTAAINIVPKTQAEAMDDPTMGGRMNQEKFDPRTFSSRAPFGTRDQHRPTPGAPRRGAFG